MNQTQRRHLAKRAEEIVNEQISKIRQSQNSAACKVRVKGREISISRYRNQPISDILYLLEVGTIRMIRSEKEYIANDRNMTTFHTWAQRKLKAHDRRVGRTDAREAERTAKLRKLLQEFQDNVILDRDADCLSLLKDFTADVSRV